MRLDPAGSSMLERVRCDDSPQAPRRPAFAHDNGFERQRTQHDGFMSAEMLRVGRVGAREVVATSRHVTTMSTPASPFTRRWHHNGREPRKPHCEYVATALADAESFRARCLHVSAEPFG
jgi:hypothetical protein